MLLKNISQKKILLLICCASSILMGSEKRINTCNKDKSCERHKSLRQEKELHIRVVRKDGLVARYMGEDDQCGYLGAPQYSIFFFQERGSFAMGQIKAHGPVIDINWFGTNGLRVTTKCGETHSLITEYSSPHFLPE